MARSNKPVVWSLFAAGGTFAAFFAPVLIIVTGLAVPLGLMPPGGMTYERVLAVAQNPTLKFVVFGAVFLLLWHAAHRLRITAHDFGLRADKLVMIVCYGAAALATAITVASLLVI